MAKPGGTGQSEKHEKKPNGGGFFFCSFLFLSTLIFLL